MGKKRVSVHESGKTACQYIKVHEKGYGRIEEIGCGNYPEWFKQQ